MPLVFVCECQRSQRGQAANRLTSDILHGYLQGFVLVCVWEHLAEFRKYFNIFSICLCEEMPVRTLLLHMEANRSLEKCTVACHDVFFLLL